MCNKSENSKNDQGAFDPTKKGQIQLDNGCGTTILLNEKGEFWINDRLVETDRRVYEGFCEFLNTTPLEQN